MAVTFINLFNNVPQGKEEEFASLWTGVAEELMKQPGAISMHFHRALNPNGEFQFVNVGFWASPEHWKAAVSQVAPQGKVRMEDWGVQPHPGLYEIVLELWNTATPGQSWRLGA